MCWYKTENIITSTKCNLFSPWYSWQIWHTIITHSLINNLSIINMLNVGVCPQTMSAKYKLKWNIWLIDYLLLNSQRQIYPNCRQDFPVLSSFMTYHRFCIYNNTMGATSGAGTFPEHPSSPSVLVLLNL